MTLLLKQIFGLIKMLNSETGHNQLAAGVAAGFVLGMSPMLSLQTLLIFLIIFFFRVQMGAAFLAAFFFAFLHWCLDPVFSAIGSAVLTNESLLGLFTTLYNMPLVPFTKFNDSIVMGAGIVTVIASPFVFLISRMMIMKYREQVVERFKQTKLWKSLKATALFNWYYTYDKLY